MPDPAAGSLNCGARRAIHDTYAVASREMLSIFYADMDDAEIDAFERTLRKVLGNLEARERTPSG